MAAPNSHMLSFKASIYHTGSTTETVSQPLRPQRTFSNWWRHRDQELTCPLKVNCVHSQQGSAVKQNRSEQSHQRMQNKHVATGQSSKGVGGACRQEKSSCDTKSAAYPYSLEIKGKISMCMYKVKKSIFTLLGKKYASELYGYLVHSCDTQKLR